MNTLRQQPGTRQVKHNRANPSCYSSSLRQSSLQNHPIFAQLPSCLTTLEIECIKLFEEVLRKGCTRNHGSAKLTTTPTCKAEHHSSARLSNNDAYLACFKVVLSSLHCPVVGSNSSMAVDVAKSEAVRLSKTQGWVCAGAVRDGRTAAHGTHGSNSPKEKPEHQADHAVLQPATPTVPIDSEERQLPCHWQQHRSCLTAIRSCGCLSHPDPSKNPVH
eukprot:1160139-Pelagomonas_calceolata.AAC.5